MKIEILPAAIVTFNRKNQLKTLTENAVDLDPEKSKSTQDHLNNRQGSKKQTDQKSEFSHPNPTAALPEAPRVHVVA